MWMVYLRFDDQGEVKTYHVGAGNKESADQVINMAEQRGLTPASQLIEYAVFHSQRNIYPKHVPNFHYYELGDFSKRWETGAQKL